MQLLVVKNVTEFVVSNVNGSLVSSIFRSPVITRYVRSVCAFELVQPCLSYTIHVAANESTQARDKLFIERESVGIASDPSSAMTTAVALWRLK